MCECDFYNDTEKKILEEKPYDWKKHMLFTLPEQASFLLTLFLGSVIAYHIALGVTGGIVDSLPSLCDKL